MEFSIKTYKVPVKRDEEGKASFEEVKLDDTNLVDTMTIEIKQSSELPPKAREIMTFNNNQLTMANIDPAIAIVKKRVLCK